MSFRRVCCAAAAAASGGIKFTVGFLTIRQSLIKLAHQVPETRKYLLPLLTKTAIWNKSPTEEGARKLYEKYRKEHPKTKKVVQDFFLDSQPDRRLQNLVTFKERRLPENAIQRAKSWKELYSTTQEAHEHQVSWLGESSQIAKELGARVIREDLGSGGSHGNHANWYKLKGPVVLIGPIKSERRAKEKAKSAYGGDLTYITDIVRASIGVDHVDELPKVLGTLRKSGMVLASRPRNRFANPTIAGYRDLIYQVRYPNGHIGELQLHIKAMLAAKEKGHEYYEKARSIFSKAQKKGKDTLSAKETQVLRETIAMMKELYERAWEEGGGAFAAQQHHQKLVVSTTSKGSASEYFNFNGLPAKWEYGKIPVVFLKKGGGYNYNQIYDLEAFFHEAEPISEIEFNRLRALIINR